ncbi:putative membrane protein YphA (DoxX/SURF4 family) [Bradyrhizobium sp. USDA 4520]
MKRYDAHFYFFYKNISLAGGCIALARAGAGLFAIRLKKD